MALTQKVAIPKLSPVYNPVIQVMESDKINELNFNYIFDIYSAGTSTLTSRIKIPPNPDGFGVFNGSRILSNYVIPTIPFNLTGFTCAGDYSFDLKMGESYTFYWSFTDNFFTAGTFTLGFTGSTQHYFQVGDRILVQQVTGATNPEYNGVWEVFAVPNNTSIVVNRNFLLSTPPESGTCVYSDLRVTNFTNLVNLTNRTVHNAAIGNIDFINYDYLDFDPAPSPSLGKFYTNAKTNYKIRTENNAWLNVISDSFNQARNIRVQTFNTTGGSEDFRIIRPTGTTCESILIGLGPKNLNDLASSGFTALTGSTPIIKSDTDYYDVWVENNSAQQTSDKFRFKIYEYCNKWDNFEIIFMDRKGSFLPMNFELVQRKNISSSKTNYKRGLGDYNSTSNSWGYQSYDKGLVNINNQITERYTITSNWLTNAQSLYFEELLTSPEIYWNYDGNGTFISISLTKTGEEIKDKKNTRLIQYTLEFEVSNNNMVQLGN